MKTFDMIYSSESLTWVLRHKIPIGQESIRRDMILDKLKGKSELRAIDYCRKNSTKQSPISLRIHRIDGKFQKEFTYPRSADPRMSKG